MDTTNYNHQLRSIYQNMFFHQQNMAYATYMGVYPPQISTVPAPIVKVESVASEIVVAGSPMITSPIPTSSRDQSSCSPQDQASCSFSLDTEIPREEIEGDLEVIMVKHFQEVLKALNTTLNGLRGKKFGYRELLEISLTRPTYSCTGSTTKRIRTSSNGSMAGSPHSIAKNSHHGDEKDSKKAKLSSSLSHHDTSFSSDDGRLMIDWNEHETAQSKVQRVEKKVTKPVVDNKMDGDDYKPSKLRFERLKAIQKKKPRFNIDNLDLTYHSNMARSFPGTENRSEEQQQRRDKNTLAARVSRNKNKAYERILEQQSVDATVENLNLKRQVACLRVYANSLMKLSGLADTDFSKMWEENIKDMILEHDD